MMGRAQTPRICLLFLQAPNILVRHLVGHQPAHLPLLHQGGSEKQRENGHVTRSVSLSHMFRRVSIHVVRCLLAYGTLDTMGN